MGIYSGETEVGYASTEASSKQLGDLSKIEGRIAALTSRASVIFNMLIDIGDSIYGSQPEVAADGANMMSSPDGRLSAIHRSLDCLSDQLASISNATDRLRQIA